MKLLTISIQRAKRFLGIEADATSDAEKLVSILGCGLAILSVYVISYKSVGSDAAAIMVPSMGASSVLVFVVPHARLSQPWAVIGGNVVSALVGVTCYKIIPHPFFAAGLSVALAVAAMHFLACMHPPGGATALVAVIGGPSIHALGYGYAVIPVMLNVMLLFLIAVMFNSLFPWRRYPASIMRFTDAPAENDDTSVPRIEKRFIESALQEMDMMVDVTSDDLQRLITLTLEKAELRYMQPREIKLGHYYTNGEHGGEWSVRQIIDESVSKNVDNDMVIYRTVEGSGLRSSDSCTRREFARWATREVFPNRDRIRD